MMEEGKEGKEAKVAPSVRNLPRAAFGQQHQPPRQTMQQIDEEMSQWAVHIGLSQEGQGPGKTYVPEPESLSQHAPEPGLTVGMGLAPPVPIQPGPFASLNLPRAHFGEESEDPSVHLSLGQEGKAGVPEPVAVSQSAQEEEEEAHDPLQEEEHLVTGGKDVFEKEEEQE